MKSKILVAAMILLSIISCRRKATEDYTYYKPYVNDSVTFVDTISPVLSKEDSIVSKDTTVAETPAPEIKSIDLNDHFFIVVASYVVEEYAIARKNDLISQGYQAQIFMTNEDGWYKLAVESHQTYSEAKEAIEKVKNRGGIFSSAVIVSKKNK